MKNTRTLSQVSCAAVLAVALTFISQAAHADAPKTWAELSNYLKGKYVLVTTNDRHAMHGRFVEARADSIVVDDGQEIEVPRASLMGISVERNDSNMARYAHNVKSGYENAFRDTFSEWAVWGLVEIPGTTIYAALTAPLALLGDLFHHQRQQIIETVPIPQS